MRLIQVLGARCRQCDTLKDNVETAVRELGIEATIQRVSDIQAIIAVGAMLLPALAIDGEVRLVGRVASAEDIKKLLT